MRYLESSNSVKSLPLVGLKGPEKALYYQNMAGAGAEGEEVTNRNPGHTAVAKRRKNIP